MLEPNEFVDRFNKEQKRRRLEQRKLKRRARFPEISERVHKALDAWDEFRERPAPADCVSKKWIG